MLVWSVIHNVIALGTSGGGDKYIPAHKRMAMGGGSSYNR